MHPPLEGMAPHSTSSSSSPPAREAPPQAIFIGPPPPQDDLVEISRQILAHVPEGPGEWLLIRDPHLILLKCHPGGCCDLAYSITIPQLWGRNRNATEINLPTLPYCSYAPCSQPMPASAEILDLARDVLASPPPSRDGRSLFVRDNHLMIVATMGSHRTIQFWTTVAELQARSIAGHQLQPQPPLATPASLLVDRH